MNTNYNWITYFCFCLLSMLCLSGEGFDTDVDASEYFDNHNIYNDDYCKSIKYSSVNVRAHPFRVNINHVEGKWLDNSQGYTSLGLFKAFSEYEFCDSIAFIDSRGHLFNSGRGAANLGFGIRRYSPIYSHLIGANFFYDYRKTSLGSFNQVGIGFEFLSQHVDVRINGYFPLDNNVKGVKHKYNNFTGNFYASCQESQHALTGLDFEIGSWLIKADCQNYFDLYGAVGAHYFGSRYFGPEVRLEAWIANYLSLQITAGYNKRDGGMLQGVVNFSLPLCINCIDSLLTRCCDCCRPNIYQPVQRQEIVVLGSKKCCWTWNWDSPRQSCHKHSKFSKR